MTIKEFEKYKRTYEKIVNMSEIIGFIDRYLSNDTVYSYHLTAGGDSIEISKENLFDIKQNLIIRKVVLEKMFREG